MKKVFCVLLVCSMTVATGCGGNEETAVGDVLAEQIASEETVEEETQEDVVVVDGVEIPASVFEEVYEEEDVAEELEEVVEEIPESTILEPETPVTEEVVEEVAETAPSILDRPIDVDLTKLSALMIYGEVYSIVSNPESYAGKVIKMNGPCFIYENPETGEMFYAVIIQDATACCTQGLEFILADDAVKPYDYPSADEVITVVGEIEVFEDFGMTFCRIKDGVVL